MRRDEMRFHDPHKFMLKSRHCEFALFLEDRL
jgi:hypothetical protein